MRVRLPSAGYIPLRTLPPAASSTGSPARRTAPASWAVFVAGIWRRTEHFPFKAEVESFHSSLASLAEVAAFGGLGLTIDLSYVAHDLGLAPGPAVAALLVFVARPLVGSLLLAPVRLNRANVLLLWGGLKGAVPILLAAFAVLENVHDAKLIYSLVFRSGRLLGAGAGNDRSVRRRALAFRCA